MSFLQDTYYPPDLWEALTDDPPGGAGLHPRHVHDGVAAAELFTSSLSEGEPYWYEYKLIGLSGETLLRVRYEEQVSSGGAGPSGLKDTCTVPWLR